jgi:hypothetical protein
LRRARRRTTRTDAAMPQIMPLAPRSQPPSLTADRRAVRQHNFVEGPPAGIQGPTHPLGDSTLIVGPAYPFLPASPQD